MLIAVLHCHKIKISLSKDYRRYELANAKSTIRRYTIEHYARGCKIGRVRVLQCGKYRPGVIKNLR